MNDGCIKFFYCIIAYLLQNDLNADDYILYGYLCLNI
ncbi:hypothetical protein DR76_4933 (plasmid) [Escherichia coli ATCC 25922]|nr:hypothetical protein DR76_4933 [Escherichia coli ATCC 25922]